MATRNVTPASQIKGDVTVSGDKSISHRAVILGSLSETPTAVHNFLNSADCRSTVEAFRAMGVTIEQDKTELRIQGKGLTGLKAPSGPIDCGNSGTTARLLMGVLTGQPFAVELRGDASLSRRPMGRVMEPLIRMGANFTPLGNSPDTLPLRIQGCQSVQSIMWVSPVASAQVKSALLLAGLYASGETEVQEPSLSRDHTERMLRACGVTIQKKSSGVSVTGPATVKASEFHVPGDFSSAAFILAAGLLLSKEGVTVRRVGVNPTRTGFLDVLKTMGADITLQNTTEIGGEPVADITAKKSFLTGTTLGGDLIPRLIDEIPIIAVLASQAKGDTLIKDASELRVKETDRIATVHMQLANLGVRIFKKPDGLLIKGPGTLDGGKITKSHGDHRLAMALAIAGLIGRGGPTTITDVACIDTSFPDFWKTLDLLRAR